MKAIKALGVIILFAIAIYMALNLKKRIVQTTCNSIGNYKATKANEVLGSTNEDEWYCCPENDKTTESCMYYGK